MIRNHSLKFSPFIQQRGNLLRAREKTMETADWRPRKLRFQQTEKNPSRARVSGNPVSRSWCFLLIPEGSTLISLFKTEDFKTV